MEKIKNYQDVTNEILKPEQLQKIEWTGIVILRSDLGKNVISFESADLWAIKAKWENQVNQILWSIPTFTEVVVMKNWAEENFYKIKSNLNPESYFDQAV